MLILEYLMEEKHEVSRDGAKNEKFAKVNETILK